MSKALILRLLNEHRDGSQTKTSIYAILDEQVSEGNLTKDQVDDAKKQIRRKLRDKKSTHPKQVKSDEIITARCYKCGGYYDNHDIDLVVAENGSIQHACKGCLKEDAELNQRPISVEQLREKVSWPDRHEMRLVKRQ